MSHVCVCTYHVFTLDVYSYMPCMYVPCVYPACVYITYIRTTVSNFRLNQHFLVAFAAYATTMLQRVVCSCSTNYSYVYNY